MAERLKLKVLQVRPARQVGQAEVLEFTAVGEDKKTWMYGAWSRALYEYIKEDAVIDVDVEVKVSDRTNGGGEHYVNRKIVQLYVNGQPVIKKPSGRAYGKSPEEIKSIEAQVAVKAITDLEIANKTLRPELLTLRDTWLKRALIRVNGGVI
jgi:hypothetical protein